MKIFAVAILSLITYSASALTTGTYIINEGVLVGDEGNGHYAFSFTHGSGVDDVGNVLGIEFFSASAVPTNLDAASLSAGCFSQGGTKYEGTGIAFEDGPSVESITTGPPGTDITTFTLELTDDIDLAASSAIYTEDDDQNVRVAFCIKATKYDNDASGTRTAVNYRELAVGITLTLGGDLTTTSIVTTTPRGPQTQAETSDYTPTISITRCDGEGAGQEENQGLLLCVNLCTTDARARMESIKTLSYTSSPGSLSQNAVTTGAAVTPFTRYDAATDCGSSGSTNQYCCQVNTVLTANFYETFGVSETVSVSGVAVIEFNTNGVRRHRLLAVPTRDLAGSTQEQDFQGTVDLPSASNYMTTLLGSMLATASAIGILWM